MEFQTFASTIDFKQLGLEYSNVKRLQNPIVNKIYDFRILWKKKSKLIASRNESSKFYAPTIQIDFPILETILRG